jgi:hypothetical protein
VLGSNWHEINAPQALPSGSWHHVAGVLMNGTGGALYVDGQLVASNPAMDPPTQGTTETDIGRFAGNGGSRHFSGIIDDVRVFRYARSSGQIRADFDARGQ